MKKTNYSIKKLFKKGIATLLTASMVVTAVQAPAFADNVDEEVTESSASVTGLVNKKITLELVSDELKEAALTAIRENRLFDAQDYLAATGDNQKALREYEAFFNENPGLYVVDAPESVVDTLSGEDAELRIFVQKDAKMAKVDLTASPSEITREDSTESKNVEFRYGTDKDIILYEPASNVDTLVNGGEDAYYIEPEQEIGDNSDYELTGNEKITFMFVNSSEGTVRFTLKVDGVTYDKVEVGGREAALKKIIAEAGTKKSTEETTVAETTVAETTAVTEETTVAETTVAETTAVTAVTEETTVADETTAAEVQEVETEAPAEETTAEGTEIANADADSTSADTEETTAAVEETAAETEAPAADTDAEVKEEAPAEVTEEPETEATIPEKIAEAISEAFGGASDAVLGRMTVYAETIVGEGVEFEVEENAPAASDSEEAEDKDINEVVAEAVEAAAGEDTATEAEEVNEETTAAVEAAADDNTALAADTTALQIEVSEGLSEDEAENQVEETTAAQEVTIVETEPETVAETEAPKETIAKDDETKAAKVATASEIAEYDDFALELIAEVKEEVLQDKAAAKENIKVARIAQYTINELGKIHYETEVDGFNVEVFAAKNAFGDITPTLEAKKLAKPEEAEASEDKLTDNQVAELKANDIYDNSQSLDIHFVDGFGKELEPSETVKVRITLSDENLLKNIDATSLEVVHLKETDNTLKTEKVAATKDVTLLDKNDEEIKDSDLEADAEAVAAGEEAEVEVASAVAEFDVDSFSTFTIYWSSTNSTYVNIMVHYVDEKGNDLIPAKEVSNQYLFNNYGRQTDVVLSYIQGGVTNYIYKEARLDDSQTGSVVATVSANNYYDTLTFYDENGKQVGDSVSVNSTVNEYTPELETGDVSDTGETLYYYDYYPEYDPDINERQSRSHGYTVYDEDDDYYEFSEVGRDKYDGPLYTKIYPNRDWFKKYDGDRCIKTTSQVHYVGHHIYLVYKKEAYTTGGNIVNPNNLGAPTVEKKLTHNKNSDNTDDGTYTLTLSVTGSAIGATDKTKANVLIVLDASGSMTQTRMSQAKSAIQSLGTKLIGINENGSVKDAVEIALITFNDTVTYKSDKVSTTSTFTSNIYNKIPKSGTYDTGTNWEAGLIAANRYDFKDDDPVYIIFVSDGQPTYRVNANGDTSNSTTINGCRIFGTGYERTTNVTNCLNAAKLAAGAIKDANKKLYAVYVFGSTSESNAENHMKALFGGDKVAEKNNYFRADSLTQLNSAFDTIQKEISQNVTYANVDITDGLTSMTASTLVSGNADKFTYEVYDENGSKDSDAAKAELARLKVETYPATYNSQKMEVEWIIGGGKNNNNFELKKNYKYSVSFVVWPNQSAFDTVASANNGTGSGDDYLRANADGTWSYTTNTKAQVTYQVANKISDQSTEYIDRDPVKIPNPEPMTITNTKLGIAKLWKMDNYDTQHTFIEEQGITLKLIDEKNNAVQYKIGNSEPTPWISVTSSTNEREGQNLLWKSGTELSIAPGVLVSVKYNTNGTINDDRGFSAANKTTVTYGDKTYYQLEAGHSYHFDEKSHNHKFILEDCTYHPMIVDGKLKNIKFDKAGNFVEMVDMEKFIAQNILKFDDLTVYKQYQGNMAVLQDTKFALNLYDADGNAYSGGDDIVELNTVKVGENTIKKLALENGHYTFTITPTELAKDAEIVITLPADVYYVVTELNPAENAGYTTYWGTTSTSKDNMTPTHTTEKFKLSGTTDSVNTIYFINEKKIDTPTGFRDNINPFVVLALTGLASMVFLAYDFQKRRLFED